MRIYNFAALIQSLLGTGESVWRNEQVAPEADDLTHTSLRIPTRTRRFYEIQAQQLGVSVNQAILMVLNGVVESAAHRPGTNALLTSERFVNVFLDHDLTLIEAASLLKKFGVRASDLSRPDQLVDQLTPESINWVAENFKVNPRWLNDKSDYCFDEGMEVNWYKNIHSVATLICRLAKEGREPVLRFICSAESRLQDAFVDDNTGSVPDQYVGISIEYTAGFIGAERSVRVFWRGEFQRWNYNNCRFFYKALVKWAIAANKQYAYTFNWWAIKIPDEKFNALCSGKIMTVLALKGHNSPWFVDDLLDDDSSNPEQTDLMNVNSVYDTYHMNDYLDRTHWLSDMTIPQWATE